MFSLTWQVPAFGDRKPSPTLLSKTELQQKGNQNKKTARLRALVNGRDI